MFYALLSALVLALSAPLQAETLCSIAEARDFLAGPPHDETPFVITGNITSVSAHIVILEDADAAIALDCSTRLLPQVNTRIVAKGLAAVPDRRCQFPWMNPKEPWIVLKDMTLIGTCSNQSPQMTSLSEIDDRLLHLRQVVTEGTVVETFPDDVDTRYQCLLLKDGDMTATASIATTNMALLSAFTDARVRLKGRLYIFVPGARKFSGPFIMLSSIEDLDIIAPPPKDPFDVPLLEQLFYVSPRHIAQLGKRRLSGTVAATWQKQNILLLSDDGRVANIKLIQSERLPHIGTHVTVAGHPETDYFRINLSSAVWREDDGGPFTPVPAETCIRALTRDRDGRPCFNSSSHGKSVRLNGLVKRLPPEVDENARVQLEDDGIPFSADVSTIPHCLSKLKTGCLIRLQGTCLMDIDNRFHPGPSRISGCTIVVSNEDDIQVLNAPPFWTAERLLVVIVGLVLALVAIVVWNRSLDRKVRQRTAALLREELATTTASLKVEERTRLAAELHDALSQNLSAVACQVSAAKSTVTDNTETQTLLTTAERMLQSSRTELTRCLWDLRGDALEETDFTRAIENTLRRLSLKADLHVRFNVLRTRVDDTAAHAILCIVRELVTNAVKHGKATEVRVAGETHENVISFSVRDNGTGFDTEHADGTDTGHFGLEGIRDRTNRLNDTFEITSSVGHGAKAVVTLPLGHESTATEFTA